ncbi:MAG TPA: hypothetical protein VI895_07430 [Bdellovibrionota bacterium]|nr:hypothetical protein [Bdellovibrionota bacterium]
MKIWKENDRSKGLCPKCKEIQPIVFRRGVFPLKETKKNVKDVLLGVCTQCDEIVSVPPQSVARIKEVRFFDRKPLEVRIPSDVKDIVLLVVDTLGATVPQSALSLLVRNYLIHMSEDRQAARQAMTLLKKANFFETAPSRDRISIKLSPELNRLRIELHDVFETDANLVKGVAVLSRKEVLDEPDPKRIKELRYSILQAA